jgi:endo-1,4-beta-xylanase
MRIHASAFVRACLFASLPLSAMAQAPVIVEAESGALGASLTTGTLDGATFVETTENNTGNPTPARTGTYSIAFPAAGTYDLYVRMRVGPAGGDDDSFYVGNGFNNNAAWALYNTASGGFTAPGATVVTGGAAGTQVFKWVRLTEQHPGVGGGVGPAGWVVPDGTLTQTFYFGTRENGMYMDKFAFGIRGVCYTVAELDAGLPGTAACPPPPPPPPPPYTRPGPPIATGLPKYLGSAWSPGNASANFAAYFNKLSPENAGKWGSVEGTRDVYNWTNLDTAYQLAKSNGWPFHFHVLVWGNQQPDWMRPLPEAEQLEEIREWFELVATRYPDIDLLEVVNEPLHDPPCSDNAGGGNYCRALGGNGDGTVGNPGEWNWVLGSFRLAKQYFTNPNTKFMLNDYSITNDTNQTTRYIHLVKLLKEEDLIDVVGIQGHAFEFFEPAPMPNYRANLDRLANKTGLPIHVTEFDVDGPGDAAQLAVMQRTFPIFWDHPAVSGVTLWGYKQFAHWRQAQGAWLIWSGASEGAERPAMQWLIKYAQNKKPYVAAQEYDIIAGEPNGTLVANLIGGDDDSGDVLGDWRLEAGGASALFAVSPAGALTIADSAAIATDTAPVYSIHVSVSDGYHRSQHRRVKIYVTR